MIKKFKLLLNKVVSPKYVPFRFPNKYELLVAVIIAVPMCIFIPKAQQEQLKKSQEAYAAQTINSQELPTVEYVYKGTLKEGLSEASETINEDIKEEEPYIEIDMFTNSVVNVRSSAGTTGEVLAVFPQDTIVTALKNEGDWTYIGHDGRKGWICSEYLTEYNPDIHLDIQLNYIYQDLIRESIDKFGLDIDEYFVYGMIYVESRFDVNQTSHKEAQGLIQIIPQTWNELYRGIYEEYPEFAQKHVINNAYDVSSNLVLGIYYLKVLKDDYAKVDSVANNSSQILTCYNRGPSNTSSYFKNTGTYSTSYSKSVLRAAEFIRQNKYWKEGI